MSNIPDSFDVAKLSALQVLIFMRTVNFYDSVLESKLFEFLMNVQNCHHNCLKTSEK